MTAAAAWPAFALVLGAASGASFDIDARAVALLLPSVALAAILAYWRTWPRTTVVLLGWAFGLSGLALSSHDRAAALRTPLRTVLDASVGGFDLAGPGPPPAHALIRLRAVLVDDAAPADGVVTLRVRALAVCLDAVWHEVDGGLSVSVSGAEAVGRVGRWRAGRRIEAPVTFRRPMRYFNDGGADAERDAALNGTTLLASVKSGLLVRVVAPGSVLDEMAGSLRASVRRAVARWVGQHDAVSAAVVTAVLLGDRTALPEAVTARLQQAGTYHVIAISGGNIAVLASLLLGAMAASGVRGHARYALVILALVAYARLVTAGPSVWRATLAAVSYCAARVIDHRVSPWQALALAAGTTVVPWPLAVRNVGSALTFGAAGCLLWVARLNADSTSPARLGSATVERGSAWHRVGRWLVAAVGASLAVEVALLPVSAFAFSRITVAGLVLNIVAIPLMAVAQVAGLAVAGLASHDTLAAPAGWVAHVSVAGLLESARLVEVAPWLTRRVAPPSPVLVVAYYAALGVWQLAARAAVRRVACGALLLVGAGMVTGYPVWSVGPSREADALRWTLFDVGQGDAMLLEFPDGRRLAIDAGGNPFRDGGGDVGPRVLSPALWARGVRYLDVATITHGDPDHAGGMRAVMEDFRVPRLWEGVEVPTHDLTQRLYREAAARGAHREALRDGDAWSWGGVRVRVLHPPPPDWVRPRVRNDDSVVLELVYGDVAVLLTGDISEAVEASLVGRLSMAPVRMLKVAHHGSRTSSSEALLDAWRPQVALVSCGRGNRFGHPSPDALARLAARHTDVWRTDLHGQLTVDITPRRAQVRAWAPSP